ncbi:hypothetical protein [Halobacterium sp. R2-5]|uniref:hypothetical protein n=1 Tax=Halobacterium sp. R2-5 TaxID=2715751 RepID=UPI00142195B8|nr:hypothetical protein [Halobacterium sp. R2-5]NIC00911.1 hypothetical protein [Halobacterium sp. R2-5]
MRSVFDHIHNIPHVSDEVAEEYNVMSTIGFESLAEFNAAKETATEKIGEALWIYELLEAYRFPPIPENCVECGHALGGCGSRTKTMRRCVETAEMPQIAIPSGKVTASPSKKD